MNFTIISYQGFAANHPTQCRQMPSWLRKMIQICAATAMAKFLRYGNLLYFIQVDILKFSITNNLFKLSLSPYLNIHLSLLLTHSLTHSLANSITHLLNQFNLHSLTHTYYYPLRHSPINSLINSITNSLIQSLTYSPNHQRTKYLTNLPNHSINSKFTYSILTLLSLHFLFSWKR